ncbi:hypothetical protein TrRE_jg3203 [Triparma retinervis]|uniref:Uncharacterized protein n=1 Tax=Triparma retinervis TaxID=2557542 RepID=A0A9W7E4Q4_9STRA|nr:hypothetical protein TrRE_jg3203 [Triparma retinervis]
MTSNSFDQGEGLLCLWRGNMESLTLACRRSQINSLEDLTADMLRYPGKVSEITVGDDQFTFAMEGARTRDALGARRNAAAPGARRSAASGFGLGGSDVEVGHSGVEEAM